MTRQPHDPRPDSPRLDQILRDARTAAARHPSVLPDVERRLATTAIQPSRPVIRWSLAASLLLAIGAGLAIRSLNQAPPPSPAPPTLTLAETSRLELDDTQLIEHASHLLTPRAVAVTWSYRTTDAPTPPDGRSGKYTHHLLRTRPLADGRTLVCSLFLADPSTRPALEPPTLVTRTPAGTLLSLSASPTTAPPDAIAHALQASNLTPDDVLREVDKLSTH